MNEPRTTGVKTMNREQNIRQQAIDAARELVESLELSTEEQRLVLGIALDRFESVRLALEGMGVGGECLSAVFAAALEYSETLTNDEDRSIFQ
jgi:hypothetical protein